MGIDGMTHNYEYDVALSFAGEQRDYVREVAKVLAEEYGLKVFFDEFEEDKLWGKIYMIIYMRFILKKANL
jgi:hypothetical protein